MNPTSTQVQNPWRTTFRTIVWLVIALIPSIPTIWNLAQDQARQAGLPIPQRLAEVMAWAVVGVVFLVGFVQRLVLIPGVAAVIAKIPGLSPTAPVAALQSPSNLVVEGVSTHTDAEGTETSHTI